MINILINGQQLKKDEMLCITPSDGEAILVFSNYGRTDSLSFNTKEDNINVDINITGEIPSYIKWEGIKC